MTDAPSPCPPPDGAASCPPPPPGWESWDAVMLLAIGEANKAATRGEVPVGAVVISREGVILGKAGNACIGKNDPSAHAELLALRRACRAVGNYRLEEAALVATLEPCLMCLGAMVHARMGVLVFGARDPKSGAAISRLDGFSLPFLNHRVKVWEGVLAEECGGMLTDFFRAKRKKVPASD